MDFPASLLAFGFTSPLLLWGALLAGAPVLIHLLFRRQYREQNWAAMQFLAAAVKRQSRWSNLDQWLLLALRTLIPLLVALALAGPFLDRATGSVNSVPVHRVLVLDVSESLQTREGGRTRWSRLRDAAADIVAAGIPGDTWQLFVVGRAEMTGIITDPTFLAEAVREELQLLECSFEAALPAGGLASVAEALKSAPPGPREVYLLTDAQRAPWRPASAEEQARLQDLINQISRSARVIWKDVSQMTPGNWAITELTLSEPFVMIGQPLRAMATLRQFGDAPVPATVEWRVDGRVVASQPVEDASGSEVRRELQYVPSSAGDLRIEASIPADALTPDDRRGAVCVVREAIRVLLVDGRPSGLPFENATDFLRLALTPDAAGSSQARIASTVITDGQLLSTRLDQYDVVFLCDVPQLTDREGDLLRRYVSAGGGLVIGLGPGVRSETYENSLGGDKSALLPGRIGELVGDPRMRDRVYAFSGEDFSHPVLSPFRGNPNTGFELTQTFAYRRLQPLSGARVAVAFDSGDPAILDRAFGRGRVLLLATAADRSWGTWSVWGHTFVPMVHEMVRYLLSGPLQSRQILVGEVLRTSLPPEVAREQLSLRTPDDERQPLGAWLEQGAVAFPQTRRPGFYGIESSTAGSTTTWFAVNPDPRESDLTPLTAAELRDGMFAGIEPDEMATTASGAGNEPVRARLTTEQPVPRWLLGGVLILLIGEPFFAWNRRLGILIAGGLTMAALAGLWFGGTAAILVAAAFAVSGLWFRSVWTADR